MLRFLPPTLVILTFVLAPACSAQPVSDASAKMPLVVSEDFEKGAGRWQPTDPKAWRVHKTDEGKVYNQFKKSKYKTPYRSPFNVSLLKGRCLSNFDLTLRVQSTSRPGSAHRDMCIFFNYQDAKHFYYVHLGEKPDPHSSQIMIVNEADRKMITENKSPGIPWDTKWHNVKVVRRVDSGLIEIYFDDMKKPVMVAHDKTFTWGQIGVGSFDDQGNWDDVKLHGIQVYRPGEKKAEPVEIK